MMFYKRPQAHINYRRTEEGVIIQSGQVRNIFTVDTAPEQCFDDEREQQEWHVLGLHL